MAGLTNYAENAILNHIRGGTAFTQPSGLYIKLHNGDPGEDADQNASATTGRLEATFGAASGGSMALSNGPLEFTMTATETPSHFSVWDHVSAGNPLGKGALNSPAAMNSGEILRITALTWSAD